MKPLTLSVMQVNATDLSQLKRLLKYRALMDEGLKATS